MKTRYWGLSRYSIFLLFFLSLFYSIEKCKGIWFLFKILSLTQFSNQAKIFCVNTKVTSFSHVIIRFFWGKWTSTAFSFLYVSRKQSWRDSWGWDDLFNTSRTFHTDLSKGFLRWSNFHFLFHLSQLFLDTSEVVIKGVKLRLYLKYRFSLLSVLTLNLLVELNGFYFFCDSDKFLWWWSLFFDFFNHWLTSSIKFTTWLFLL